MTGQRIDDADRALLARLVGGDVAEDAPEVVERLRRNPDLRAELALMRGLVADLDASGDERAREIEDARRQVDDQDVAAARHAIALHPPGRQPWWRRPWVRVAAAAVLVTTLLLALWFTRHPRGDLTLGSAHGSIVVSPPRGPFHGPISAFTWDRDPPPGGHFEVEVYAARNGQRTDDIIIMENRNLEGRAWLLDAAEQQRLADHTEIAWDLIEVGTDRSDIVSSVVVLLRR